MGGLFSINFQVYGRISVEMKKFLGALFYGKG